MAINSGNINWKDSTGSCSIGTIGMSYRCEQKKFWCVIFCMCHNMLSTMGTGAVTLFNVMDSLKGRLPQEVCKL